MRKIRISAQHIEIAIFFLLGSIPFLYLFDEDLSFVGIVVPPIGQIMEKTIGQGMKLLNVPC